MMPPSPNPVESDQRLAEKSQPGSQPKAAGAQPSFDESAVVETREAFLGTVSHELKTPITALRLSAQLLFRHLSREGEPDVNRSKVLLEAVDRQSEKLSRLGTYLMDVSRSGTGSLPLEIKDTDLVLLVQGTIDAQKSISRQHSITLNAPSQLFAQVDPARMEQVIFNLLDNAIKYSPNGGPITVEVTQLDGLDILISVRDHGVGVPLEHQEDMFDRFSPAHDPAKPGLGLGLYICRRVVDLHAGELTAEFPQDGGTRMMVRLPSALTTEPTKWQSTTDCPGTRVEL